MMKEDTMICLIGWMTVHAHEQAEGACVLLAEVLVQQCCMMARCCVAHACAATHFGRRWRQLWTCCCAEVHEMSAILQGAAVRCAATMTRQVASDCAQQARWCVADDALLCSCERPHVHTPSTLQGGTKN